MKLIPNWEISRCKYRVLLITPTDFIFILYCLIYLIQVFLNLLDVFAQDSFCCCNFLLLPQIKNVPAMISLGLLLSSNNLATATFEMKGYFSHHQAHAYKRKKYSFVKLLCLVLTHRETSRTTLSTRLNKLSAFVQFR